MPACKVRPHLLMLLTSYLIVTVFVAIPASSHTGLFQAKWGSNRLSDGIKWRFASDFPTGDARERMKDGASRWNTLYETHTGAATFFNFEQNQTAYQAFPFGSCPTSGGPYAGDSSVPGGTEKDAMHWGVIDGAAVGQTLVCTFAMAGGTDSNSFHSFQIKMDSSYSWYTGAAAPGQNDKDMLQVAVHEFGHATGRIVGGYDQNGHFDPSGSLCVATEAGHHTMCASTIVNREWDRSLNTHDKDAFENAY